ncbi:MAG TPA: ABC transporter permease subunit [Ktedonobacterales bacterium]|nr:ABC transporter permease subunit [Ktedonobacterales bacterium]
MNPSISTTVTGAAPAQSRSLAPSFIGLVRAELYKMWAQWTTRIVLGLLFAATFLPYVLLLARSETKSEFLSGPLNYTYTIFEVSLTILRVFGGFALLIIAARSVGLEYQQGTIRILLARGVGRVQLLTAKLAGITLLAIAMLIGNAILNGLLYLTQFGLIYGAGDKFSALTADFWSHIWAYYVTVLISMAASILLALCVAVVGRSLSFGVSAALSWFAADNFAVLVLFFVYRLTGDDIWLKLPAYFLGPILNQLPSAYVPALTVPFTTPIGTVVNAQVGAETVGLAPFVTYDATHALVVVLLYCIGFAATAFFLTWRRDVME